VGCDDAVGAVTGRKKAVRERTTMGQGGTSGQHAQARVEHGG
jgi:hypothetical protein